MQSGAITFSFFMGSILFFVVWTRGNANQHQQNPDSHESVPDPKRPYLTLWRKRGNNAINYQYNLHKPVQNGQVNQHGSVTLFKPAHKKNKPDRSGFVISYSISQDFDSSKPLQHNQNNMGVTPKRFSQGFTRDPYPAHQSMLLHPTLNRPQYLYRNIDPVSQHRCYDSIDFNQISCCMPSYNGRSQRCWKQNIKW